MKVCTADDQCNVLLIEDTDDLAELYQLEIQHYGRQGFKVCRKSTLAEGLACIDLHADSGLDIILLDLQLPDSYGLSTLASVLHAAPITPVVVLTSLSDEDAAQDAIDMGAQDYVVKGDISGRALTRIMRYSISRNRIRQQLWREAEALRQVEKDAHSGGVAKLIGEVRERLTQLASSGA